jgi:hypothetical protein
MAVASPSLKGLSQKFGGSAPTSDFKQSASNNNSNVSKIAKDLANAISSQKRDFSSLHSSIEESLSVNSQTSAKMEQTNSLLGESISIQNNMLTQLKSIASYMKKIEEKDKEGGGGKGSWLDWISNNKKNIALTAGGLGAAGVLGNEAAKKVSGSGAGSIDPSKKFGDLTEEEKTKFLEKQSKAGNIDKELNNPGGLKFNEHAKKFGAEEGPNGLAKFSSADKGKEAHRAQWESPDYSELPVGKGLDKWQGGGDDKPASPEYKTSILGGSGSQQKESESGSGKKEGGGQVYEDQMKEASVRKLPIDDKLKSVLTKAAEAAGVDVRVKSGGQPAVGEEGARIGSRTGSTRHDKGMAADLDLYADGKRLSPSSDPEIFKTFVKASRDAGATGIGAGEGYMSQDGSRLHVGFGASAIWGAGGQSANAADWLKNAMNDKESQTADSKGGTKKETGSQVPGPTASNESTRGTQTAGGPNIGPKTFDKDFMGGKVIPFEPKRGVENGFPGQGGILGSILSALTPSKREDAPIPQTPAAQGNLAPSYAKPGSDDDTAGRLFEADKANTAKVIKEKATEEAATRQNADEAASRKQEQQRPQQTEEPQLRQASYNPGSRSDDSSFGKGDWAGDVLRYYGINAA